MDKEFDEIDNIIFDYFSNKEIPEIVENGIASAMYERYDENKILSLIKKIGVTIISILTISCGIVFAKDIEKFFKNIFSNRQGIETAIENGYILSPDMKYVESNNTKIKIDNILMDDYNLNINFKIQTNESSIDIKEVYLSNMIISDENNNILYCNNEDTFRKFCNENGLSYIVDKYNEHNTNNGENYYIINKENNTIDLIYNLSAIEGNYPKSKRINIYINEIEYNKKEKVEGDWLMKIEIPEKFYNREAVEYKEKNNNNSKIKVLNASIYNTELKLELEVEDEEQEKLKNIDMLKLRENMQKELEIYNKSEKTEEDLLNNVNHHYIGPATEEYMSTYEKLRQPISNICIENEKGEQFKTTYNTSEDIGVDREYAVNAFKYTKTFDITKYESTNKLKVYFKYKGEDVIIELERNN